MAFSFEKLIVWQISVDITSDIYELSKKFPREEIFGLTSQIRRACDSISLNIAEGSTGQSKREFKRFLGYAIRSGIEVIACLYLARRKKLIGDGDFNCFYNSNSIELLIIKLQSLRKRLI